MMNLSAKVLVAGLLLSLSPAQGEINGEAKLEDLGALLAPIREQYHVPAMGAAVIVGGNLVALGVDGVRKLGDETEVTKDDLWHLGSCTKAMTATLLARQVMAKALTWDASLAEGLPELRDKMDEGARDITILQLLHHRAGLPSLPSAPLWQKLSSYKGSNLQARREVATSMLAIPPMSAPGSRFLYSNAGYMILGAVAERVAKKPWQEIMQSELFTPLGMKSAGFGAPGSEEGIEQPWGHVRLNKELVPVFTDNPPAMGPAGTVHASLEDWAKFIMLHLGVEGADRESLLDASSVAALHSRAAGEDYAAGWMVTKRGWSSGPVLWHNGSNTLWYCVTWLAPEEKFAVLVTSNQGDARQACDAAAASCIRRFRR